jgi:hypothetical protein
MMQGFLFLFGETAKILGKNATIRSTGRAAVLNRHLNRALGSSASRITSKGSTAHKHPN